MMLPLVNSTQEDFMANIVILDDDPENAADLYEKVGRLLGSNHSHHIRIISTFRELVDILMSKERVDVLITDIVMPEGQPSGIDIVRRLFPTGSSTQVIYVSGFLDQALEVYPSNHLFFLLKPVDDNKPEEALDLALSSAERSRPYMLRIKVSHKERLVNAATISFLRSELRKITIFTKSGNIETYAKLDDLAPQLPDSFVRCHRSYIVSLAYASSLQEDRVLLRDGTRIPVSRRRAKDVQRALLAYITGRS